MQKNEWKEWKDIFRNIKDNDSEQNGDNIDPFEDVAPGTVFEKLRRHLENVNPDVFMVYKTKRSGEYWGEVELWNEFYYITFFCTETEIIVLSLEPVNDYDAILF